MKKQGIFSAILPMLISFLALSAFAQDEAYIYNDGISSNTIDGGVSSQINTDIPVPYACALERIKIRLKCPHLDLTVRNKHF